MKMVTESRKLTRLIYINSENIETEIKTSFLQAFIATLP